MSDILKLSVSKSKTFIDCKRKYKFAYVLKLPRKEFTFHTYGKFAHKILEDFHNIYIKGCDDPYHVTMTKVFKESIEQYKDKLTAEMIKECKETFINYLKILSEQKKNDNLSNVIACEKEFNLNIENKVLLNGMIDRIQIDSDGIIHVGDYKTVKNKKYLKEDFFQLLTYAYVMLAEDPSIEKVRASYILLRHDFEYITKEFTKEEILKIKDKYLAYADQILTEENYQSNPSPLCGYCDWLSLCQDGMQKVNFNLKFGEVSW